ncbi:B-cell receptor CD22-like [Dicentrarchus labrax]|uniref:B-cell receptor CD22-like n=1 Tax=Dicentrarchus labrax TaxID=13489 RepID=UPI0021F5319A|nr:B-cell receptor CD22-like [Dicentrarchus labrax]
MLQRLSREVCFSSAEIHRLSDFKTNCFSGLSAGSFGALADCPNPAGLFITTLQKMEALSGSCLQIPCNFSAEPEQDCNSSRETFGVWIKNDPKFGDNPSNVIFNSSKTVNTYPMNITGNLSQKNCTTLFSSLITSYTDTYYFRIMNWPFRATAVCDPLQIKVKDSPPSPRIEISGDLKEKQSVTITCSAFTPCPHSPPKLTWNLQQDSHNQIEENTDGTFTTKIQESFTLSDQHDGYNITCSVRYPVNEGKDNKTAEERKTLSVSYAPKNTSVSVSPSGLVSAGSWVNLTCSSRAKPPVSRFTWFKNSKDGPMIVSEGPFYSFNVTDGGVYYCVATNALGNETSSEINLTVKSLDSPPSPRIEISGDLKEKQSVTITCSAFTPCPHSPPKLTWNLQQDSHNQIEENTDGTFTTKIQESITLSDQHDGYNITCSVRYPVNEGKDNKTAEERKTLSVSYAPKNTSVSVSPSGLVSAGSWVNLTCSSRAKPPVIRFTWFKNSKDGPMNVSEGPFYSFNVTDGGVYYCVAKNDIGNETSSEINLTVRKPPVNSPQWGKVLGGIIGIIALLCLVVCVWRLKSTRPTPQQTESQTGEELTVAEPARKTREEEEEEENIHYGEIDFSKRRPEPSSDSVQDSGRQQETLYAQVKVSKPANRLTHTADGPEDIYAQVKNS